MPFSHYTKKGQFQKPVFDRILANYTYGLACRWAEGCKIFSCASERDTMAPTICLSFGELRVTPNDSDVPWRSDGHF